MPSTTLRAVKIIMFTAVILSILLKPVLGSGVLRQSSDDENEYFIRALPESYGFAFTGEGTTGGAGGTEVTVTTAEELMLYLSSNEPFIINVVDTLEIIRGIGNYEEKNGAYRVGSNTTIRGIGRYATIMYGGFWISNARNVIVQNLHFDGTFNPDIHDYKHQLDIGERGPSHDAIEIGNGSENIWITQCSFKRYSDEALSIYNRASNVTISWNKFDDLITGQRGMMILIGSSDLHTGDRGRLNTTLHHNYMASRTRHPRTRYGKFHIFNNYYHNIGRFSTGGSYGIASTMEAQVLVEGNYFENVSNPWYIGYGDSPAGYLDQENNIFVNSPLRGTRGKRGDEIFEPEVHYNYELQDPNLIPSLVLDNAGAGTGSMTEKIRPIPSRAVPVTPGWGAIETIRPEFIWQPAIFVVHYEFTLFDGDGEAVLDTLLTDTSLKYPRNLAEGAVYYWRVRAVNENGASIWSPHLFFRTESGTTVKADAVSSVPSEFVLSNNYPNPFNPATTISFGVPELTRVDLRVYDIAGREVAVLVDGIKTAGFYSVKFKPAALASGVYLYRFSGSPVTEADKDGFSETRSMIMMR